MHRDGRLPGRAPVEDVQGVHHLLALGPLLRDGFKAHQAGGRRGPRARMAGRSRRLQAGRELRADDPAGARVGEEGLQPSCWVLVPTA